MKATHLPHRYLALKFGVVAVLPILIISGLALQFLAPQLKKHTAVGHESMARSVAGQISAHLMGGERQLLALSTFLESNTPLTSAPITQLLDAQCGTGELFETIYLASIGEQSILHIGLAGKPQSVSRLKREDLLGLDISGHPFIFMKGKTHKSAWSETFLSTVSNSLAVALTIPVKDNTLIGEITLDRLSELISHLPVEETLLIIVLDRNGRIIADSQRTRWGRQLELRTLPQEKTADEVIFSSIPFELDGKPMLGVMVKVDNLEWSILVAQPAKTAYKPLTSTFLALVLGLAFALFLALAVAWLQAAKLSNTFTRYAKEKEKHQDDLLAAMHAAEAASRAKSEFLANMSHDLRTPLNGIMGMLQLLDQTPVSSEQHEYVETALKSSKRLTGLLSDILDLSRVEAGKMPLRQEPFALAQLFSHLSDLCQITFKQTGVKLESSIHPAIPEMMIGDGARLQQVLNNLLGNAAKFTRTGYVALEAYPLPPVQPDRCRILFTVTDTGIGIDPKEIEHIFEPFRQAGNNWQQNIQGSGLGLAICKRLVKLMEGDIFVESEPAVGTTVSFCISFGNCTSKPVKAVETEMRKDLDLLGLEILVAEDDSINAITIKWLLEKFGCRATIADNGAEALKILVEHQFHAVFMDIQMPVMDGLETVQAIRQGKAGEEKRKMPVFALTAYAMSGDQEHFMDQGMDGYLSKPVDLDKLQTLLRQVAALYRQRPQSLSHHP